MRLLLKTFHLIEVSGGDVTIIVVFLYVAFFSIVFLDYTASDFAVELLFKLHHLLLTYLRLAHL